jgi:choice-of-anchor A domain-containing protein
VIQQGAIVPTGGFSTRDLTAAISDATSEANALAALSPTQSLGSLGSNVTLNGNGGVNVVNVSGIKMNNGTLTLSGSASDIFIINDSGKFASNNSSMVLTGGVTPNHVLFNVSGDVMLNGGGGSDFFGTILAPSSNVSVHDKSLTGEIIGLNVSDTAGFKVNGTTAVPGPSPMLASAIFVAVVGLGIAWRQWSPKAA